MHYVCVQKKTFKFTSLLCLACQRAADAKSVINEVERRYSNEIKREHAPATPNLLSCFKHSSRA